MKASTQGRLAALTRSSTSTQTSTSNDVRKAAFTLAVRMTTSPTRIGALKVTSSSAAVTAIRPQ